MERLTMTDAEMEEIRQFSHDFNCPIKAKEGSQTFNFCDYVCDKFQHDCPFMNVGHRLKAYEDAEEQGLLLRLDSKDELIEVLASKLLNEQFGACYMCKNPMKNITLDGIHNGCDGECNLSEEHTVDDFIKKIVGELERNKQSRH